MHHSDSKYSEEMAWPFSKPFCIILNRSVESGSWAANPDTSFDYLTEFDYVRVYQKKDAIDYYSTDDGHVSGIEDAVSGSFFMMWQEHEKTTPESSRFRRCHIGLL